MPTAAEVKALINSNLRAQTAPNSINPDKVSDELDRVVDFASQNPTIQTLADGATVTMNVASGKWASVILGGNRTFAFSGLVAGDVGLLFIYQDGTGSRTLSWPGNSEIPTGGLSLSSGAGELTVIGYIYDGTNIILSKDNYGVASVDTTAPTVVSAIVSNASPSNIVIVFSESVTGVSATGWSFKKNGSAWSISSVSGSGTTWTFTMSTAAVFGDTLLRSYNSATGATIDAASNELVTFTDSAVTNNVSAGGSFRLIINAGGDILQINAGGDLLQTI